MIDGLLEIQRQAAQLRVPAGIDLHQQQLEQRLVRRVDGLVQLPQAGADELAWRYLAEMAEIEHLVGAHEALGQQRRHVIVVAMLLVVGHQPPQWRSPAEPQRGAVELVEQQIMLRGAAVVGGQLGVALALGETFGVDQKEVRLAALARRPGS